ncbi:hypothetical protein [Paenibacillus sp. N3.4]|uniref:WD40/YVTN/BNR-like repeat-containing protein n=1 Tax=Paenibacillus sp. N3.4 TaxID=2603222 RepID=UPI00164FEAEB|nr:hypothetical protein [Paenibacillus sp. N3.4]
MTWVIIEIKVEYHIGKRILFSKTFVNQLKPALLNPVINYNDLSQGLGEFSSITLETPASGLIRTENGKVALKGTVTKALGTRLLAVIEKEDGDSWIDPETVQVPFDAGRFASELSLVHGTGRYRVTLRSPLSIPAPRQNNPYIDVARYYIDYKMSLPNIVGMQGPEGFSSRDWKLIHTSDTGQTWEIVIPDGISEKDHLIAANFNDGYWGYTVYLTSEQQPKLVVCHQLYGGGWETATLPTLEAWETSLVVTSYIANLYYDPIYVMLTSSSSADQMLKSLYRSDDRGKTWKRVGNLNIDIGSGNPTGISFRKEKEGWITAMYHGQNYLPLYRTKDGGQTWSVQQVDIPSDLQKVPVSAYAPIFDQENDHHGLFIAEFVQDGEKTYIPFETRDAGDSWTPLKFRLHHVQDIPVFHFDNLIMGRAISKDGKTIYLMDTYNHDDWQTIKPNISLQNASQFFLGMDGYGWVLLNGSIMVTHDGGRTWNEPNRP